MAQHSLKLHLDLLYLSFHQSSLILAHFAFLLSSILSHWVMSQCSFAFILTAVRTSDIVEQPFIFCSFWHWERQQAVNCYSFPSMTRYELCNTCKRTPSFCSCVTETFRCDPNWVFQYCSDVTLCLTWRSAHFYSLRFSTGNIINSTHIPGDFITKTLKGSNAGSTKRRTHT